MTEKDWKLNILFTIIYLAIWLCSGTIYLFYENADFFCFLAMLLLNIGIIINILGQIIVWTSANTDKKNRIKSIIVSTFILILFIFFPKGPNIEKLYRPKLSTAYYFEGTMYHNFLEFYEDGIFVERCSSFGTRIREGKFEKRLDTILIYYNNNNATSKVWKGTISKDAILFQNSKSRALEYQHVQNSETKPIDWGD